MKKARDYLYVIELGIKLDFLSCSNVNFNNILHLDKTEIVLVRCSILFIL